MVCGDKRMLKMLDYYATVGDESACNDLVSKVIDAEALKGPRHSGSYRFDVRGC